MHFTSRLEQRQQLEAHGPSPEWEGFRQQNIRPLTQETGDQLVPPPGLPGFVDRMPRVVDKIMEPTSTDPKRRQLDQSCPAGIEPRNRQASHDQRYIMVSFREGARDQGRPTQMPDAKQMLYVEEYSLLSHPHRQ